MALLGGPAKGAVCLICILVIVPPAIPLGNEKQSYDRTTRLEHLEEDSGQEVESQNHELSEISGDIIKGQVDKRRKASKDDMIMEKESKVSSKLLISEEGILEPHTEKPFKIAEEEISDNYTNKTSTVLEEKRPEDTAEAYTDIPYTFLGELPDVSTDKLAEALGEAIPEVNTNIISNALEVLLEAYTDKPSKFLGESTDTYTDKPFNFLEELPETYTDKLSKFPEELPDAYTEKPSKFLEELPETYTEKPSKFLEELPDTYTEKPSKFLEELPDTYTEKPSKFPEELPDTFTDKPSKLHGEEQFHSKKILSRVTKEENPSASTDKPSTFSEESETPSKDIEKLPEVSTDNLTKLPEKEVSQVTEEKPDDTHKFKLIKTIKKFIKKKLQPIGHFYLKYEAEIALFQCLRDEYVESFVGTRRKRALKPYRRPLMPRLVLALYRILNMKTFIFCGIDYFKHMFIRWLDVGE